MLEQLDQKPDSREDLAVGLEVVAIGSAADHRICASLVGYISSVVSAGQEALHGLGHALEAELAEAFGELGIVTSDKLGEVISEEPLEGVGAALPVGARRGGGFHDSRKRAEIGYALSPGSLAL